MVFSISMVDQKLRERMECLLVLAATGMFAAYLCFVAPSTLQGCDYVEMWKPIWKFLTDALKEGRIPLWNPYIDLGRPFVADASNAVFYPPLYLICVGPELGFFLLIWLHFVIAVFGMRRLGEVLQVGRAQSYFMALCFLGSGALTARWMTGQIPYCWALCYAPWLFHGAVRTNEPWNTRRVGKYALMLALQFLCGNPHVFWFTTIGQGVFILGRAARLPVRAALADLRRGLTQFGVVVAWCLGLVAMELLPFLELAKHGNRNAPSPAFANFFKLQWEDLGSLFSPLGISRKYAWINWEMNLFVGGIVVVLGVAGLCRVREPNVRGWVAVLVVGLLIAVGDSTPAFGLFYHWLPGFASLRIHARAAFLVVFALICGSGIWLSRPHPRLQALWSGNFTLPARYAFIGIFLFQAADLLLATRQIKATYTFANIFKTSPDFPVQQVLVEHLQAAGLLAPGQPPPRVCVPQQLIPPNNAMMYRYSNFDGDFPLFMRRDWDYLHHMLGLEPSQFFNTQVANAVFQHGPFPYADLALSVGFDPVRGKLCLATNTSPRAFLVYAAEVVPDYNTILGRLTNGHDIHQSALVEKPLPSPLPATSGLAATLADIKQFETDSLLVEVDAKADALLVLAEAWYPGWRAEIDGRDYDCVPANLWMRSVPVEAGKHQVRFYFHQDYLLAGTFISAASACGLIAVLVWPRKRLAS